ncbi:MAG: hypothetical protein LC789_11620 [Actinobacteria bacterium]|nr:hypothetical protein [Actinomycetota bacterium]
MSSSGVVMLRCEDCDRVQVVADGAPDGRDLYDFALLTAFLKQHASCSSHVSVSTAALPSQRTAGIR